MALTSLSTYLSTKRRSGSGSTLHQSSGFTSWPERQGPVSLALVGPGPVGSSIDRPEHSETRRSRQPRGLPGSTLTRRLVNRVLATVLLSISVGAWAQTPEQTAEAAVLDWLAYVDDGDYARSWNEAGTALKERVAAIVSRGVVYES